MTQLIIDEFTSRTPIGELLVSQADPVIELRASSGELLGTLVLPERSSKQEIGKLEAELSDEKELIQQRLSRPPTQGLSTPEFLQRLQQLGRDA